MLDRVIIIFGYILAIFLFCKLIRIRIKPEEKNHNKLYVLITAIILLLIIWGILRNFYN